MKSKFSLFRFAVLAAILFTCLVGIYHFAGAAAAVTAYCAANCFAARNLFTLSLGVSVVTQISDLWVPQIWKQGLLEPVVQKTAFIDSGAVVKDPLVDEVASGAGVEGNIPFIVEPNPADQVQQESVAPDTNKFGSGLQKCAIINRVSPLAVSALASAVSGAVPDPVRAITQFVLNVRKRQRNKIVLNQLAGLFDVASVPASGTGVFRANRLDNFSETGASPASNLLIDTPMLLDGLAKLGENKELLIGGAIVMHSVIEASLSKQNQIDVIRNSEGEIVLRQWKGLTVYISDLVTRAGGVSGNVYHTYLFAKGSIALGEKPQVVTDQAGEVAALQFDRYNIATNNVALYDRTRTVLHPQGAKWTGTPALVGGASNSEFATAANWALAYNDIKNVRIVCIRTNG